ncbi:MAG: hypothetical protein ABSG15_01710 [FCB group bacterium]
MKTHFKIRALIFILSLFIASQAAFSQSLQSGIGITAGYFNAYNDVRYVYNCYSCQCNGVMENFNKGNYFAGLSLETSINVGIEISLLTKLYYNSFSFVYTKVQDRYPSTYVDSMGREQIEFTTTQYAWEGKYSLLSFDIMPKITIPNLKLGIFFGFSFSYLLDSKYTEIYRLVGEPHNARFTDNPEFAQNGYRLSDDGRSIYFKEGEIPYKNDFRYGLKFGLTYDYDIFKFRISPFVSVDYPLSSVINGINTNCPASDSLYRGDFHWKITYLQAGIDLKYMF